MSASPTRAAKSCGPDHPTLGSSWRATNSPNDDRASSISTGGSYIVRGVWLLLQSRRFHLAQLELQQQRLNPWRWWRLRSVKHESKTLADLVANSASMDIAAGARAWIWHIASPPCQTISHRRRSIR